MPLKIYLDDPYSKHKFSEQEEKVFKCIDLSEKICSRGTSINIIESVACIFMNLNVNDLKTIRKNIY
jgi:hypothetical protein